MSQDVILGNDGCSSDEMTTTYLRRGGLLVARCEYSRRERLADAAVVLADLDRRASIARDMADLCYARGAEAGDYPARQRAAESCARAIRAAFGLTA